MIISPDELRHVFEIGRRKSLYKHSSIYKEMLEFIALLMFSFIGVEVLLTFKRNFEKDFLFFGVSVAGSVLGAYTSSKKEMNERKNISAK